MLRDTNERSENSRAFALFEIFDYFLRFSLFPQ